MVYADGVDFAGAPPYEGERVILVRGAGPLEGTIVTGAVVRHHPDDGRLWVHADAGWPEPLPLVAAPEDV